ncbi:MAG: 2-C-methyl-D-erythritol 2,4-cyclodiphosphate synthase [Candidatus Omnitrophica bacterium]|nr:2-C-methyl-D-erythritol 2,4-cyclodiphosphate synthase [Candidatus Omnitrophota bacterium]
MNYNVIIPAAGSGRRMRSEDDDSVSGIIPKQFLYVDGVPMVYHSIRTFSSIEGVTKIIIATQRSFFPWVSKKALGDIATVPVEVVQGGKERADSVNAALRKVDKDAQLVIIHDAARPFIHPKDIERVISAAKKDGAAILSRSVVPTVKKVAYNGLILGTVPRTSLRHAETPQVFKRSVIIKAHKLYLQKKIRGAVTDDAYLVERAGYAVRCVEARYPNVKITDRNDLDLIKGNRMNIRIGSGFDTHRLVKGRPLFLGGIKIPFPKGCLGHSDGDVLIHAIIDALLGAVGTKDIGEYFPNKNKKYKNIASLELLDKTREIIRKKKYGIGNIDTTIICEKPHISKWKKAMIETIAECLEIDRDAISIKGKTKEGLDSEGQGFSISAYAIALLIKEKK